MKQGRGIPFGIRLKDWSQRVLPLAGWLMLVAAAGWIGTASARIDARSEPTSVA